MDAISRFFVTHRRPVIAAVVLYCFVLITAIIWDAAASESWSQSSYGKSLLLDKGWIVFEDKKLMGEEVALPYRVKSKATQLMELQTVLPQGDIRQGAVVVTLYQCTLEVRLDDELLYESHFVPEGRIVSPGSMQAVVPLPQSFAGKTLSLRYTRHVPNDRTGATSVRLIDLNSPHTFYLLGNQLLFFVLNAVFVLGAVLAVLALSYYGRKIFQNPLVYLALFALLMSLWLLCNLKMTLMIHNPVVLHNIEYLCFFSFPLPVWGFAWTTWQQRSRLAILQILLISGFLVLAVTLKFFGIADFYVFNLPFHLLALSSIGCFTWLALRGQRRHEPSRRVFAFGLVVLGASGLADLVRFYFFPNNGLMFFFWGLLVLAGCVIISYLHTTRRQIKKQVEQSLYKQLAYTDRLTGLSNRLTFEEDVETLSQQLGKYHSIVFINSDVNRFKRINDTYGHMMGDRALQAVANELHRTFEGVCSCYRMGGDEFCMIALDCDMAQLEALLNRVNDALNRAVLEFPISVAFGVAEYNHFLHRSLMDVFKEADDKMYEHKRKLQR